MKNEISAIKCLNCGAPMYTDWEHKQFSCLFCGAFRTWDDIGGNFAPYLTLRHRPLESVDGLIKLDHLSQATPMTDPREPNEWLKRCGNLVSDAHTTRGFLSFDNSEIKEMLKFPCPVCKAEIRGYRSQNTFKCNYCGNEIDSGSLIEGGWQDEYAETIVNKNLPSISVPFKISMHEAKQNIFKLIAEHPNDFKGQDIERRMEEDLKAVYLPHQLIDASWKFRIAIRSGEFWFFQECINWAWPDFTIYDHYLLNELFPWDYGRMESFKPLLLDESIRIVAPLSVESKTDVLNKFVWRNVPVMLKRDLNIDRFHIRQFGADVRKHHIYIMLPVYYLDRRKEDQLNDKQLRIAVNAQTGKTVALFLHGKDVEYTRVREPDLRIEMTHETTIVSAPTPIRYIKPNYLHKVTSLDEAIDRKGISAFFYKHK